MIFKQTMLFFEQVLFIQALQCNLIRYPNQFVSFCKYTYVIRLICVPVIKFFFLCYELETVNLKIFDYIDILCTEQINFNMFGSINYTNRKFCICFIYVLKIMEKINYCNHSLTFFKNVIGHSNVDMGRTWSVSTYILKLLYSYITECSIFNAFMRCTDF